jgi:hypothetical protein
MLVGAAKEEDFAGAAGHERYRIVRAAQQPWIGQPALLGLVHGTVVRDRARRPARIMREHRQTGDLHTNAWTAERLDRALIWRQANDRLRGRAPGVPYQ